MDLDSFSYCVLSRADEIRTRNLQSEGLAAYHSPTAPSFFSGFVHSHGYPLLKFPGQELNLHLSD